MQCAVVYHALLAMELGEEEKKLVAKKLADCTAGTRAETLAALEGCVPVDAARRFERLAVEGTGNLGAMKQRREQEKELERRKKAKDAELAREAHRLGSSQGTKSAKSALSNGDDAKKGDEKKDPSRSDAEKSGTESRT